MQQQFNIQQLYALPTLYLCILYLSENKQRLVPRHSDSNTSVFLPGSAKDLSAPFIVLTVTARQDKNTQFRYNSTLSVRRGGIHL